MVIDGILAEKRDGEIAPQATDAPAGWIMPSQLTAETAAGRRIIATPRQSRPHPIERRSGRSEKRM
jgi:hypothetical protein